MTAIAELERIAANAVRPSGNHTVVIVEAGTTGGRLPNGAFSGIGGTTRWGPAWFDGLRRSAPIHLFDRLEDARALASILDGGPALRSAPHSVAALTTGSAERGAAQSADTHPGALTTPGGRRSVPDGPKASTKLAGMPAGQDAGAMPGADLDSQSAALCAACGRSLADLSTSRTGQKRKTCGDACRKAYQRGHRAPVSGVVAPDSIHALSRLPRHLSGFGHGDPHPSPDPAQLALLGAEPA